jgi:hypothetical protein
MITAQHTIAACALIIACGFTPPPHHQPPLSPATAPERPSAGDFKHCLNLLAEEAKTSRANGSLMRNDRTFAKEFGRSLAPLLVLEKITKRVDSDDFIDAYVRWQLSGFDVPEFAMTDRAFDRMLETLPAFIAAPRANDDLIQSLSRAVQLGQLSSKQQEEVNVKLNDLAAKSSAATTFKLPALEFRTWLIDRCNADSARAALLAMERAASLAAAGWPNDDAKRDVDSLLEKAARKREFTLEQRRDVILRAENLITTGRMFITSASVSNDALAVEYATTGVFDFDVRQWEKLLRAEQ